MADLTSKTVKIYIDNSAAEYSLEKLNEKAALFSKSLEKAKDKQALLNREIQAVGNSGGNIDKLKVELDKVTASANQLQTGLNKTNKETISLKEQIDKGLNPSLAQQERYVQMLKNQLRNLSSSTQEYGEKIIEFKKADATLNNLKESFVGVAKAQRNWLQDAKTVAFGVIVGNTVQSAIQSVAGYVTGMISGNAKMSDSLAKVQQTTGMTADEVKRLSTSLRSIDTRTAQGDLLKIAEIGGQFNVPREQIKGFVEQIDKANVVLSGQFSGGIEEVSTQLSLLRNVFVDIKSNRMDDDLGHISNALIELAQKGTATAPIIAEFGKRLSPLISTAKLTSAEVLALGTTMGGVGIPAERGGTAVVRIFDAMTSHTQEFSKVAGMTDIAFKKLFQQDSFGAFKAVLEGFKKGGDNVLALNATLQDMEIHGIGAKEALVKLSNNIGDLSQYAKLGTTSLTNMNSINEKFNLNNQNLAASLEKLSKNIAGWFANSTLTSFFNGMITSLAEMTSKTKSATDSFDEQVKSIVDLKLNIVPLADRYEELKDKTKLNKNEQEELDKIINQIASSIPGAVSEFDEYGRAIAINTDRVNEFVEAEKARLKVTNAAAIEENKKALMKVMDDIKAHKKEIDQIAKKGTYDIYSIHTSSDGIQTADIRNANQEEIARAQEMYRALIEKKLGYETEIKKLNGDAIQEQIDAANKAKADGLANKNNKSGNADIPVDEEEVKKRAEILEKLKKFKFELEQIGRDSNEKEIERVKRTYKELIDEARKHGVRLKGLKEEEARVLAYLEDKERKEYIAKQEKEFKDNAEAEYENQLKVSADYFELKKQDQAKLYASGLIDKKQYEVSIATIDVEAKKQDIATAYDYSNNVKKAATDLLNFKKNLTKEEIAEAIKKREKLKENDELLLELNNKSEIFRLQNAVNNAPKDSNTRYDAEKNLRNEQMKQELAAVEKTEQEYRIKGIVFTNQFEEEKKAIRDKYNREENKAEMDYYIHKVNTALDYASKTISISEKVNTAISNSENAQFNRWLKQKAREKTVIEQNAKNKVITGVEAERQLTALQLEEDKKKQELERKQFERNKAISFAQTVIKRAEAVVADLEQPWKIALDIATTVAELAVISASTPKYARGGALTGPSHSQGGMPIINPRTGRKEAEVEGGEYILSKHTVQNNRAIADALLHSSMNNNGASIKLPWQSRAYRPLDITGIVTATNNMKFAAGGVFPSFNNTPTNNNLLPHQQIVNNVVVQHDEETKGILAGIAHRLNNPIAPTVSIPLTKLDDAYTSRTRIINNASV